MIFYEDILWDSKKGCRIKNSDVAIRRYAAYCKNEGIDKA